MAVSATISERLTPLPPIARNDLLSWRLAGVADLEVLRQLMTDAITHLQRGFLTHDQIGASRHLMGLDSQLIEDGTYFVVHVGNVVAGCGGWSRRKTLYGGDHSPGRDAALLDPAHDAARVRAMYTARAMARRGVGRLILAVSEHAAAAEGFSRMELAGTLAGEPLYTACGYTIIERFTDTRGGAAVPMLHMCKALDQASFPSDGSRA